MKENEKIIRGIRIAETRRRITTAKAIKQAKAEAAEEAAEYQLMEDDARANGIDLETKGGKALLFRAWMLKLGRIRARRKSDETGLTNGDCFLKIGNE